jgi:hypothetical protein
MKSSAMIPLFVNMIDESKFKFMYTYSEYDVIRVIVKGINDMYNARNERNSSSTSARHRGHNLFSKGVLL